MRTASPIRETAGVLFPFMVTIAAFVIALRLLNAVPGYWALLTAEPELLPPALTERLQYPSMEALEEDLGVKLILPRYFPSYLEWPPASVRGQREPVRVASLMFRSQEGEQAIQIREIFTDGGALPFDVPEPLIVRERRKVAVGEADGVLMIGESQAGSAVNQLRWVTGGVHIVVTTIYSPEELTRIASSIHLEK